MTLRKSSSEKERKKAWGKKLQLCSRYVLAVAKKKVKVTIPMKSFFSSFFQVNSLTGTTTCCCTNPMAHA